MAGTQVSAGTPLTFFSTLVPALAAVAGDLHAAVVGAHPDHAFLHGAGGDGDDRGEVFGAGDVGGQAAALVLLLPFRVVVVRSGLIVVQVSPRSVDLWRNWLPQVERAGVERVGGEAGVPVEAQLGA